MHSYTIKIRTAQSIPISRKATHIKQNKPIQYKTFQLKMQLLFPENVGTNNFAPLSLCAFALPAFVSELSRDQRNRYLKPLSVGQRDTPLPPIEVGPQFSIDPHPTNPHRGIVRQ